jgi:hypothetical protein
MLRRNRTLRCVASKLLIIVVYLIATGRAFAASTDTTYRYEAVPGKILGVWPDVWTVERLSQLRVRYGFNYVGVPALRAEYDAARQAGFAPANILVGFWHGYHVTAVDSFEAAIYYVDEAVEHNCAGEPSAGPIHTPQELEAIRDYVHQHRPGAKFVSGGYKRCSHFRILATYVDNIMFTSYVNWTEFSIAVCNPNLGWGDAWERPWLTGGSDQSGSWTSMKNSFGSKFSMTWIRGREDEYSTLLPLSNSLGLNGLWVYHGEPIDTTRLLNFCNAAWQNGWMIRIGEALSVQLSSFTATRIRQRAVQLDWTTLSETNNLGFYVERRLSNEQPFSELPNSFIPGHGTTLEPHHYSFIDSSSSNGSLQYRLRQVDLDGTIHFSEAVQVSAVTHAEENNPVVFELFQNYPNPFNPTTHFGFRIANLGLVTLKVVDVLGREVATIINKEMQAGSYDIEFDAKNLAGGVYLYTLSSARNIDTKKFIVLK